MLALLMGMPGIASAQTERAGPPRIDVVTLQRREADDMALLLQLRAAQRPALDAFLQSFAPPPAMPHGDKMREAKPSDGFEQHLQRMTEMTAQRAADDTRRIAAARSFYDGLDTKQRAAFEALMRLRHGPAMMGPPMMRPPMMGPSTMGPPMMRAMPGGPMRDPDGGPFLDGLAAGGVPSHAGSSQQLPKGPGSDQ